MAAYYGGNPTYYYPQQGQPQQGQVYPNQVITTDPNANVTQQQLLYPQQQQPIIQQQPVVQQPVQVIQQQPVVVQQPVQQVVIPSQVVQYVFVTDPMQELASSTSAIIKQEPDLLEAFSGCQRPNKYHIFINTPLGLRYMFKCIERGDSCARNCCSTDMRTFSLNFNKITSLDQYYGTTASETFLKLIKPCACLFKPRMMVEHYSLKTKYGMIQQASCTTNAQVNIYDNNNNLLYEVAGDCCQAGLCGCAFCAKLSRVNFYIKQGGRTVGKLTKCEADYAEMLTSADTYEVLFPARANVNEKLLIIVASLLIDYIYFETGVVEEERQNRRDYYRHHGYGYGYHHGPPHHHHGFFGHHGHGHGHW